jgi:hypothetical protein
VARSRSVRELPRTAPGRSPSTNGRAVDDADATGRFGSRHGAWFDGVAPVTVLVLAGLFAFRKIDDFDTWWHLAAGRWIVTHRSVPANDVLSATVRDHAWTNLQWAYDAALYLLHSAGGPVLLAVASALSYALAIGLLLRLVRRAMGNTGAAVLGLLALLAVEERFAVRPEMLSFALVVAVLVVLDHGRRREGRALWLLVPLMIVWVNVHSLFVIGALAIACALAGSVLARVSGLPPAARSGSTWDPAALRRLWTWGPAALAGGAVGPFGLKGLIFPIKLVSRINGSNPAFQSIAELRSPFSEGSIGLATSIYKLLLVAGTMTVAAALVVESRRDRRSGRAIEGQGAAVPTSSFDLGALAFFAAVAMLSVMARRNTAIFVLGGLPLVAHALRVLVTRLPDAFRGRLRRSAPAVALLVATVTVGLGFAVVTGAFYRWDAQPREFGTGVMEGTFPVRAAAFVRGAKLPGQLYNAVAAGGYLAWDDPIGSGVFIDGRLEVYDTAFYADYIAAMYDQARWDAEAGRFGVNTVILFHRWENRRLLAERLYRSGNWSLVYADEVAVVFIRTKGNEDAIARAGRLTGRFNQATREWLDRPAPRGRYAAGRIEGTRAFARLLATIGDGDGAMEQFSRLIDLGVPRGEEVDVRLRVARHLAATGRLEKAREHWRRIVALDPANVEAQAGLQDDRPPDPH